MMRIVRLLLLFSLVFHTGCAVFGVATRGDLDEQRRAAAARHDQMREENRVLRDRFAQLSGELQAAEEALSTVEQELQQVQSQATTQRQEIWSQTGDLQVRMAWVEDRLGAATSASDSLRSDLDVARRAAEAASTEALIVRQDLDDVADRADLATSRSETLLRAWLKQLREERGRLERQLTALEASLAQWESEVFETTPLLPGPVDAEDVSAASEEGKAADARATIEE